MKVSHHAFSLLQSSKNFVEQVLDGQFPEFAIGHEFSENLLIAIHAVDHEALEGFLEGSGANYAKLEYPKLVGRTADCVVRTAAGPEGC